MELIIFQFFVLILLSISWCKLKKKTKIKIWWPTTKEECMEYLENEVSHARRVIVRDKLLKLTGKTYCHANRDGDCTWEHCPQLRDGEPEKTGRHCPLDIDKEVSNE